MVKPDRLYVGSATNYIGRKACHITQLKKGYHHSVKLQRHVNKYGLSDLSFEIIKRVYSVSDLLPTEQIYLDAYKPYFNHKPIAGSNIGAKFGPMKQWHKDKISAGNKGKKMSQHFVDSHSVKMHKYSLDGILLKTYKSGSEAIRIEGVRIKVASKINLTISGHVWVSDNSEMPDFKSLQQRIIQSKKILCKPVLQIDKDGKLVSEFDGVRIACKLTGIDHRSIAQVAGGSKTRKTAGGYLWKYKIEAA